MGQALRDAQRRHHEAQATRIRIDERFSPPSGSRRFPFAVAIALSAAWIGCAPASTRREASEGRPQQAKARAPAREAILLPVPERAGAPPVPHKAVRAMVAGHGTLLIVDTGAQGLILSSAIAAEAGLQTVDTGIDGRDWRGEPMKMWRTDHPSVTIDGLGSVVDRPSAVTEFSSGFRMRGLGGTLSPQWLATATDDVVIDLRHSRLELRERSLPPEEASFGVALGEGPEPICLDRSGGMEARSLSVQVVVAGVPSRLAIDTGADDTVLFSSSKAAAALGRVAEPGVAAGPTERRHAAVSLRAGRWTKSVDVLVTDGVSNRACPFDGRLGLNVLRGCVVTISEHESIVRCDP